MAIDWKERLELDRAREQVLDAWSRLKDAWRADRRLVIVLSLLALGSCSTGALAAAWTRAAGCWARSTASAAW